MTPAPSQLTRKQIVRAAIELLDRDGADIFSMRRLGAALGVDPMAVYYHLPNKAALFDAVVDAIWEETDAKQAPEPGASWQEIAAMVVRALRRQLLHHPRLVSIVATRPVVTPAMLELTERALGYLAAAGLPPASAMQLLDCLVAYTVGKLQGEVREPVGGVGDSPESVYAALTPETHPHLARAMGEGYGWDPEVEFELGLQAMTQGWQPR